MRRIVIEVPTADYRKLADVAGSHGKTVATFVEGMFDPLLRTVVAKPRRKRNDFMPAAMSPAQAKRQRKQLDREIAAQHKRSNLEKLAKLRQAITAAKKSAKPRRDEAVELCRIARTMAKERAKVLRIEGREAIRRAIEQEKIGARKACDARKVNVREGVKGEVARARAELAEERRYQREIRRIESSAKKRERPKASSSERRAESDDEVRQNISPELVPLFESVKRQIKGSDRETRTEAFLRYVEENQAEVVGAIDREVQAEIARLQREEAKEARALRRRGVSAAELEAVPF